MLKFIPIFVLLAGCTYSVNMIHTKGTASDIVDENQTASPEVSPTVQVPLTAVDAPIAPGYPAGMNGPDRQYC